MKKDDPQQIAAWLVQNYGIDEAYRLSWAGIRESQGAYDNYLLSIWREVKQVIERQHGKAAQSRAA